MLGHQVCRHFTTLGKTFASVKSNSDLEFAKVNLPGVEILSGVDAMDYQTVRNCLNHLQPQVVVNCIGIIKQDALAKNPISSITVNALLPHLLSQQCAEIGARFIQISTDCVFCGANGNYSELDLPDATDLYGRTKLLGEVTDSRALTLRTSIIGTELRSSRSLLDWFLSQEVAVDGYVNAIFSGLTTFELSRVIGRCIMDWPELKGLYNVSAEPISKHELLLLLRERFGIDTEIRPVDEPRIDRSLDSTRFREITGYQPPSWNEMTSELAAQQQASPIGVNYVSSR